MASYGVKSFSLNKPTNTHNNNNKEGTSSRLSKSQIVYRSKQRRCNVAYVAKRLLKSTGKATWIAGTTFLILALPLIIETGRDEQLIELELQQARLLGTPPHW
ncbi:unnamed protein product [Ilex paraguariensis]